tara:strand:- start:678 stop:1064 length:387 start_codon:yes stop_codon:yes gene_type:complete
MKTLKQLRKEKRLTQAELAKLSGVSKKTIERWENINLQPENPRDKSLFQLSKVLQTSVSEIEIAINKRTMKKKEIFDDNVEIIDLVINELRSLQDDIDRSNERYQERIDILVEKCWDIKYPEQEEKNG